MVSELNIAKWHDYRVGDLFKKINKIKKFGSQPDSEGNVPFVTSSSLNNGVSAYVDETPVASNVITVSTNGECFDCFYHDEPITISSDVEILSNKNLNRYNALFLCTILKAIPAPIWYTVRKVIPCRIFAVEPFPSPVHWTWPTCMARCAAPFRRSTPSARVSAATASAFCWRAASGPSCGLTPGTARSGCCVAPPGSGRPTPTLTARCLRSWWGGEPLWPTKSERMIVLCLQANRFLPKRY